MVGSSATIRCVAPRAACAAKPAATSSALPEIEAPIHDRMPVILEPADYTAWLESDNPLLLQQLLQPLPAELLEAYPVGLAVNKPANGGPGLIEPWTGAG